MRHLIRWILTLAAASVVVIVGLLVWLLSPSAVYGNECLVNYDRKHFPHWVDNARLKTIDRQLVAEGVWHDPYTGKLYDLAVDVPDIDHIVSLKLAWTRGANCWSPEKRKQFANDPLNLVAVHLSANRQKSSKSIYEWMPANLSYCADYLARVKRIVDKYELQPTSADIKAYMVMGRECRALKHGIRVDRYLTWLDKLGVTF